MLIYRDTPFLQVRDGRTNAHCFIDYAAMYHFNNCSTTQRQKPQIWRYTPTRKRELNHKFQGCATYSTHLKNLCKLN
jgi:hypothetical protein